MTEEVEEIVRYEKCINTMTAGKHFGEIALVEQKPRTATLICKEDCTFAVMSSNDYLKVIAGIEAKANRATIDFLKDVPYFCQWTDQKLARFLHVVEAADYNKGQELVLPGESLDKLYLVMEGEVQLRKTFKNNATR